MTIYITLPNGDILDRYEPSRFVRFVIRTLAGSRRAWRAVRSRPALGKIQLDVCQTAFDNSQTADVISALMNLGMKKREAQRAVSEIEVRMPGAGFDELFRAALQRNVGRQGVA